MAIVGIVPAAGHATRLGLLTGSKEVQLVRGRPVMEYLLERMERAGADRIRVVVRPEKQDVAEAAKRWGAEVVVANPPTATASFARAVEHLDSSDIVLFGFPDTVWNPVDGFVRLVRLISEGEDLALGLFRSPYPERSDVAILSADGRVARIDVKPQRPTTDLVWACGAASAPAMTELTEAGELGVTMSRRAQNRSIAAVTLGRVIDIGTPAAWESAATDPVFD